MDPARRPSAAELHDELSAWLAYRPDITATANVDVLRSRVLAATTRGAEHHNKVASRAEQLKAMEELVESYVLRAGETFTQLGLPDTGHTPPRPAATPNQSDDAWFGASKFIDFHPLGLTTTQSWVGYDLPTPSWITTAVYLVSGGYIEASVDGSMRVAMLHTIHQVQKTKGPLDEWNIDGYGEVFDEPKREKLWAGFADGNLGTPSLELACSAAGNNFLAALASAIETFTDRLNDLVNIPDQQHLHGGSTFVDASPEPDIGW